MIIFVKQGEYVIGTSESIGEGPQTEDMTMGELALNEGLLDKLNLVSMYADGKLRGYEFAVKFMCMYLEDFSSRAIKLERDTVIRILYINEKRRV